MDVCIDLAPKRQNTRESARFFRRRLLLPFVLVFVVVLFPFLFFSFDEILFSVHQKRILSNIGAGIVKELPDKSRADCFMNPFSPRYL